MRIETSELFNTPETHIDLTNYVGKVYVRIGTLVYQIDVEKLIKDYGSIVQVICDNEVKQ